MEEKEQSKEQRHKNGSNHSGTCDQYTKECQHSTPQIRSFTLSSNLCVSRNYRRDPESCGTVLNAKRMCFVLSRLASRESCGNKILPSTRYLSTGSACI